jgi:site-specific DNA recombinase
MVDGKEWFQKSHWVIPYGNARRYNFNMQPDREKVGIIYCRVSSAEQVEGTSLDSQERLCRVYAERENIRVVQVFVEKGESAKTADRTEFNKAILLCTSKKQKIDYFIVYKLDRFARNQDDHAIVRANLKRFGTALRSATEPINETPSGRLMESVISGVAEFDNSIRSERSKGGMVEKFRRGIWVWRAPIGYRRIVQGGNLVIDGDTAAYIRLAFEEYSKGAYSYKSLAKFLEKRGFRTPTGKKPCMQLMQKILRNPIYCGVISAWGEEHKGAFDAIVDEELFWRCQPGKRKSKFRSGPRTRTNPLYPLRNFTICAGCSKPLTGSASTGRKGVKYPYYHHDNKDCEEAFSIPVKKFEDSFVEYLKTLNPRKEYEKLFKAIVTDVWRTNYKKLDEEHQRIEKEISILKDERQKIFRFHQEEKYTDEEFQEQKRLINERIRERELLRDDKRIEEFDMEEALDYSFRFIRDTAKTWLSLSDRPDMRSRFQNQVFPEKVHFDGKQFGTNKISLVYGLDQKRRSKKTHLVTLRGIEPRLTP